MANFIPIAGTPDGAGGFLIQPEYSAPLVDAIAVATAIDKLGVTIERTNTRKKVYPRLVGRPTAAFVDEAADSPVTGAEFGKISIVVKKIATTILYTEEELEDAAADPEAMLTPEVEQAFANLVDAHALGVAGGAAITSAFKDEDGAVMDVYSKIPAGSKIEYDQTKSDALALATSAGAAKVEDNGGQVTGVALATDVKQSLRDARDAQGRPLYAQGGSIPGVGGTPNVEGAAFTTALSMFPAGASAIGAIGGDWAHARTVIRKDIVVKVTTDATVRDGGGTDHRTFQQDKVAVKYTARIGFGVHQGDKLFFSVENAA
jgi:HK97 family phage major capsid protein